jgi:hypothetical protein
MRSIYILEALLRKDGDLSNPISSQLTFRCGRSLHSDSGGSSTSNSSTAA